LRAAPADREDEDGVARRDARPFQPGREGPVPALVVDPGRELGHVVGGRVGLEAAELAKVVDGVTGVRRRAADAQDEQPALAVADLGQAAGQPFDVAPVQRPDERLRLGQVDLAEGRHAQVSSTSRVEPEWAMARSWSPPATAWR